jgi:hypothetical protein
MRDSVPRPSTCDIFLRILSASFGDGGTEQDFKSALANWKGTGSPWIVFYLDDAPKTLRKQHEVMDYARVCGFCEELESQGIVRRYIAVRETKDSFYAQRHFGAV